MSKPLTEADVIAAVEELTRLAELFRVVGRRMLSLERDRQVLADYVGEDTAVRLLSEAARTAAGGEA